MSLLRTTFQYFAGKIWLPNPLGVINLQHFVEAHKDPKPEIRTIFNQIAKAEMDGDNELKGELKQNNLYYFTPCVILDGKGRGYDNITGFTGLLVLDFDHMDDAEEFKHLMFNRLKSCVAAYLSPSKRGVKFLIRIPVCRTVDEFKSYFYGISYYMERFIGYDGTAQNPVLPLFLSWDADILVREEAEVWKTRGIKLDEFKAIKGEIDLADNISKNSRERVFYILTKMIEKADLEQVGHKHVRSAGLVAGGHVVTGYITQVEAEDFLCELIANSPYLSKNTRGYCKTASDMIISGFRAPLYID